MRGLEEAGSVTNSAAHHDSSPPTFRELMGQQIVNIYVGEKEDHFRVHLGILCNKIPYFNQMFQPILSKSVTQSATFPDDSSESFDVLLGWVYYGTLRELKYPTIDDVSYVNHSSYWNAAKVYSLAGKLNLPSLQDMVIDSVIETLIESNNLLGPDDIAEAYKITTPGSKWRLYAINTLGFILSDPSNKNFWPVEKLQPLFLQPDLTNDYLNLVYAGIIDDPRFAEPCTFHCHTTDEDCYLIKSRKQSDGMA